jgi:hypothetical protein
LSFRNALALIMSSTGMPSVMATIVLMPPSAASMIASAAKGGGTKIIVASAPGLAHRLVHRVEDRKAVGVLLPALARRDATHHFRAVLQAPLGVKRARRAGNAPGR